LARLLQAGPGEVGIRIKLQRHAVGQVTHCGQSNASGMVSHLAIPSTEPCRNFAWLYQRLCICPAESLQGVPDLLVDDDVQALDDGNWLHAPFGAGDFRCVLLGA
jgi:hypothetical protein